MIKHKFYVKPLTGSLLALLGFIIAFGFLMIYDVTVVYSQDVFGGAYRFVFLHGAWVLVGLLGFFFFYRFDYHKFEKISYPIFYASLAFLGLTALMGLLRRLGVLPCTELFPFTPCINGATRWFYINPDPLPRIPLIGILGFQPSELMKFSLIIFLSVFISSLLSNPHLTKLQVFIKYMAVCGGVFLLVLLQPNLSTALLLMMIGVVIYISSGADLKPLYISIPIFLVLVFIFMISSPYRRERLTTFMGSDTQNLEQSGYHIKQILIALGSGGVTGVGFGQSRQKYQYLPEVYADSIFAIIGEELGFIGTTFVIILFGMLFYKGIQISSYSHDILGRLLAVGITSWIGFQFFINIAAMSKIIPLTGVPIPLVSYGGSSLVFSLMGLGILANISKNV